MAAHSDPSRFPITLGWLLRLRWGALGFYAAFGTFAVPLLRLASRPILLWPSLALLGLSNVICSLYKPRLLPRARTIIPFLLVLDTLLLTALLAASGGVNNPLSVFYLVHVALAAAVLPSSQTGALAVLSSGGYGLLFLLPGQEHAHHMASFQSHLRGMWLAFAGAGGLIAAFVSRTTRALSENAEALQAATERAQKHERLAAMTTLATGAAHRLATPLGTIALAAEEIREEAPSGAVLQEAQLIGQEVKRARRILDQIGSLRHGFGPGEKENINVAALLDVIVEQNPTLASVPRQWRNWPNVVTVECDPAALEQSLEELLKNALDACSGDGASIEVSVQSHQGLWQLTITDKGMGMAPEALANAREPFFSTKPPGTSLGLGLFLVERFAIEAGGEFRFSALPEGGATATLRLPRAGEKDDK